MAAAANKSIDMGVAESVRMGAQGTGYVVNLVTDYALRRLGEECMWVNYMNRRPGAGTATANDRHDMSRRMLEWENTKLKGLAREG